ncbi:Isoflavone 7-O-methyltransferase [Trifolium repens]|nr:Isoflavone 7-O-methyltransferase [Trifolium repens]
MGRRTRHTGYHPQSRPADYSSRACRGSSNSLIESHLLMLEVRGTGNSAKIISEAFPTLKCIVFDLPNVVEGLTDNNYLSFVGGNMFESFLQADAILLKWILHDWNDDDCVKILKISKEAVLRENKGGKVIIIDIVINKEQDEHEMT